MFRNIFTRSELPPVSVAQAGLVYAPYEGTKIQTRDIERAFARLFSTADGQAVLSHLQAITFQRALGAGSTDQQLRYLEGQRAMVASILRLIDRGRNP
jgi:hypothetical protein